MKRETLRVTVHGSLHSRSRMHRDHDPKYVGRAALPRRPNFSRNERSDVPASVRDDDRFVPRWNARDGEVGCAATHPHREKEDGSWRAFTMKLRIGTMNLGGTSFASPTSR